METSAAPVPMTCASCGSKNVTSREEQEQLRYGHPESVIIKIQVPVHTCGDCEFQFTDYVAEEIRDKAVKDYLGKI